MSKFIAILFIFKLINFWDQKINIFWRCKAAAGEKDYERQYSYHTMLCLPLLINVYLEPVLLIRPTILNDK